MKHTWLGNILLHNKALAGATTLTLVMAGCVDLGLNGGSSTDNTAQVKMEKAASDSEFKNYLTARFTQLPVQADKNQDDHVILESALGNPSVDAVADSAESTSAVDGTAQAQFSGTNNQVAGVDEGDIWKYDGENFFVMSHAQWEYNYDDCYTEVDEVTGTSSSSEPAVELNTDAMTIMPCYHEPTLITPAQIRMVKNTKETLAMVELDNMNPSEIYLGEGSLVVLGNKSNYNQNWSSYQNWQNGQTDIRILDVSDVSIPTSKHQISLDGYVVQSRRVEDELYLITRYTPNLPDVVYYPSTEQQIEQNKIALADLSLKDLLPNISINGEQQELVNSENCLLTDTPDQQWGSPSLATLTRINIHTGEFTSRCMAGQVEGIYMSENNLYLFNTSYWDYSTDTDSDDVTESLIWNWNQGNTHLHKFELSTFEYHGSAILQGALGWNNPRFRLGELSDGSIGVVTTEGQWRSENHHLTVLASTDGELTTIATLPNDEYPAAIGKPGEQVKSVRFMQNRAYIVTFLQTDPLYVIDLSNSSEPYIAGELEIPGFSEYLHPIGNDLLLGIGKDATSNGQTQGVKVSLFNVSNIQNPSEQGSLIIGERGTHTALSHDSHAFSGIQQDEQYRFAFPISVTDSDYHWSHSGLYLFEIKDSQLSQTGSMITNTNNGEQIHYNWNSRRGLIQGDDVYHLSGSDLYKADWNAPEEMGEKF